MAAKRTDYFAAGTQVVWDVDLIREKVIRVYRASAPEQPTIYRPGDSAEAEFAKAIKADTDAREYALKERIVLDPGEEQAILTERLATALAAQNPAVGLKLDAQFVGRGAEMLRATLLPYFFWSANRTEPALWLKAIYWDSGVARTPEQAIAKAYDSMPGIERPDFVPG